MYADRYGPKKVNGSSLTLSVGIVGALVIAAMLGNTVIHRPAPDDPLTIYPVTPTPPPKPEPLSKPEPQTKATSTPIVDKPIVATPAEPDRPYFPTPEGPAALQPGTSDGAGTAAVLDPPKPPAVITGIEVDPRYARDFQPLYPPAEQRAGRDGVVTLKVLVGVDGRVVRAEQLMATSDEFWRVTLKQALGRWRFKPATRDGVAFEQWRTMTVRFRLDER